MTGSSDKKRGRGATSGGVLAGRGDVLIRKIEGAERAANALISAHPGDHLIPTGRKSPVRYRVRNSSLAHAEALAHFFAPEGITDG